ncbi:MAG: adenosine kinase [Nanoarchaeota archaeon]|nr:adenosine kinase [Nanoarchaeota archaeon]
MVKDHDVVGLGNTIIDLLVEIEDHKLLEMDLKKGEFHLVDEQRSKELLEKINLSQFKIKTVPGGSSANTIRGIAMLGGKVILYGKVGKDQHGETYVREMKEQGVNLRINHDSSATGNAITFITPDAERTFSVHLGAAIKLKKEDLLEEDIKRGKILHLEGYQIEGPTRETVLHAITLARKYNTLVSIDLADPGVIRRNKVFLQDLTLNYADIVFVNEMEATEFTGYEEEQAAKEIGKQSKIVVVKLGKRGSLICEKGVITRIDPFPAKVIDTTGAGDCYAAGFLYGFCQGWPIEKAGKLGSLFAAKVVEQTGVVIRNLDGDNLKKEILG